MDSKFNQNHMKKAFFILTITLLFLSSANAQGNLEFNRAIKENYPLSAGTSGSQTITVPAGKVWKITSATVGAIPSTNPATTQPWGRIDGHLVAYVNLSNLNYNMSPFPLWLPAGTYPVTYYGGFANGAIAFSYSGIEFNIVP